MNIWGRLGISVTIVAAFCIIMTEVFQSTSYYESYKWFICATFLVLGCIIWVAGRFLHRPSSEKEVQQNQSGTAEETAEETSQPSGLPMLLNLRYWGAMMILFGIIIVFIVPYKESVARPVAARTNATPKATPPPSITNAPVAVAIQPPSPPTSTNVFPSLKLQGVIFRQPDPSVLINGRTYFIGDRVEEAEVVAIQEDRATVSWNGQLRVLILGR